MDTKQISVLEKKVHPVLSQVEKLSIKTLDDMKKATETLSILNTYKDEVVEKRETVTKPLNEALKNARALFKPLESKLEVAVTLIRNAMSEYQTAEVLRQRKEEAKIAARVGEGKGKLKFETAVRKSEEIERADAVVETETGKVTFIETKVLKIVDPKLIPDKYWVIDEKAVHDALKAKTEVPGALLEIKMVPRNNR
ncbi:MAG TPA: hypothetical protein V6D19_13080 [Stenomitos sp.]